MKKMKVLVIAMVLSLQSFVFADVRSENRTASLKITKSDGTSVSVSPTQEMPKDLDGALIEALGDSENVVSADLFIKGRKVYLTQGKQIRISPEAEDGFVVVHGKVTVTTSSGRVKIVGPTHIAEPVVTAKQDKGSQTPIVIKDPLVVEREIQAEENLPDISPIHS